MRAMCSCHAGDDRQLSISSRLFQGPKLAKRFGRSPSRSSVPREPGRRPLPELTPARHECILAARTQGPGCRRVDRRRTTLLEPSTGYLRRPTTTETWGLAPMGGGVYGSSRKARSSGRVPGDVPLPSHPTLVRVTDAEVDLVQRRPDRFEIEDRIPAGAFNGGRKRGARSRHLPVGEDGARAAGLGDPERPRHDMPHTAISASRPRQPVSHVPGNPWIPRDGDEVEHSLLPPPPASARGSQGRSG